MEIRLLQAAAARCLNVSLNVVQRLWNHFISEDYVSRRPVPGQPRITTIAGDHFLVFLKNLRH